MPIPAGGSPVIAGPDYATLAQLKSWLTISDIVPYLMFLP